MPTKFITQTDGEWFQPTKKGYRLACCDCGLVHRCDFRIVDDKLQMRAFRDVKETKARRRGVPTKRGELRL